MGETVRLEFGGEQFEWWSEKSNWTLRETRLQLFHRRVFFDPAGLVEFNSVDENGEERYHIVGESKGTPSPQFCSSSTAKGKTMPNRVIFILP